MLVKCFSDHLIWSLELGASPQGYVALLLGYYMRVKWEVVQDSERRGSAVSGSILCHSSSSCFSLSDIWCPFVLPAVPCRYFLTSFYTKYDRVHFVINTVSLLTVLIPKLPQLHGVRLFGINKYWSCFFLSPAATDILLASLRSFFFFMKQQQPVLRNERNFGTRPFTCLRFNRKGRSWARARVGMNLTRIWYKNIFPDPSLFSLRIPYARMIFPTQVLSWKHRSQSAGTSALHRHEADSPSTRTSTLSAWRNKKN